MMRQANRWGLRWTFSCDLDRFCFGVDLWRGLCVYLGPFTFWVKRI